MFFFFFEGGFHFPKAQGRGVLHDFLEQSETTPPNRKTSEYV